MRGFRPHSVRPQEGGTVAPPTSIVHARFTVGAEPEDGGCSSLISPSRETAVERELSEGGVARKGGGQSAEKGAQKGEGQPDGFGYCL